MSVESPDLEQLARDEPDEFRKVANQYDGPIRARMLELLEDAEEDDE